MANIPYLVVYVIVAAKCLTCRRMLQSFLLRFFQIWIIVRHVAYLNCSEMSSLSRCHSVNNVDLSFVQHRNVEV
jgi:hypothetical protein